MTPAPTLDAILTEFETEIARAPRWALVDRDLLARVCVELRRSKEAEAAYRAEARLAWRKLDEATSTASRKP